MEKRRRKNGEREGNEGEERGRDGKRDITAQYIGKEVCTKKAKVLSLLPGR